GDPWGNTTNDAAMNAVFGAGNWDKYNFNTAPSAVFAPGAYKFLFVDGSDFNGSDFSQFVSTYAPQLRDFVGAGNPVFLNAAQNNGPAAMDTGLGAILRWDGLYPHTGTLYRNGYAVDSSHPIFNGPFAPVGIDWSGPFFSHDIVSAGIGYT